ncbi:SusC/RagA family TonB-linked outer membrane protein [Kriegella aquimaris]|uniref:TonB-linked outer membrane protein, SusC/RagA family n=1 Tax=Kriegella aquimaris TaxID=192904 RepID=A0A1G9MJT4_9FLAO|nr:TonB-dependent receptor [Kriegella aquimaris]SDL74261.1 TonB-linked outer membrane protein, SusC/RagA family [Kriegella aquimaris]
MLRRKITFLLMAFSMLSFNAILGQVTGTVTDGSGVPLPGASIVVKGTTVGTVADFDGNYAINVDANGVLIYSYIGFKPMEIAVNGRSTVNASLETDTGLLDEVVVVGYGTQKKGEVTAAIASVQAEQLGIVQTSSTIDAVKGQISGVDIQSGGGRPGQTSSVRIRGRRSITASNDPLYVVDGIPLIDGSESMSDINPQDIASMQILKDAAATAVYGSRGANGVILVTTNRGRVGKTQVRYSSQIGLTSATRLVDMMNGEEYAALKREARRSSWNGTIPPDADVFFDPIELVSLEEGRSTDWLDLVVGNGYQTNHQLGVSGGSENTTFNSSLGYFKEQGIISNQDYERFTGRINVDHRINDIFKIGASFMISNSVQNWGSNATIGEALANNPLGVPYDAEGELLFLPTNDGIRTNPLNELVDGAYIDERKWTRIFAPVFLDINITDGLQWRTLFGPDIRLGRRGQFRGSLTNDNRGGPGDASIERIDNFAYTLENLLTYDKSINANHNLKVTLLQSIQNSRTEYSLASVTGIPYESQSFYNLGSADNSLAESRLTEWTLTSFMGRLNYDIAGKYLFQASLRADGSSRLAEGNIWNYFPGFSAGWRISEESFLKESSVSQLMLRASYGEVGNTSVAPYQTAGRLAPSTYAWGEANALGRALFEIPNADLGWEVSKTLDIGLDFGLFNGRVTGAIDWFRTNTVDILLNRSLPYTSGYESILQNIGATRTQGLEFAINTKIFDNPDGFSWNMDFNIAGYREEIVELALKDENGNSIDDVGNGWFIGQPIEVIYDYEKIGIYQADEAALAESQENKVPGEIRLNDVDGDGLITPSDRKIQGTDTPDYYGGLNNKFSYKGLELGVFFYFRQGQTVTSNFHGGNNSLFARYNNLDVDYWTIDNPTNANPRPDENQESPRDGSTLRYFDSSFIKLRNISLAYSLPKSFAEKLGMEELKLSLSGQNLWFITDYETFDPEVAENDNSAGSLGSGVVPSNKMYSLSLKARF